MRFGGRELLVRIELDRDFDRLAAAKVAVISVLDDPGMQAERQLVQGEIVVVPDGGYSSPS
jgi:hypothetical protein